MSRELAYHAFTGLKFPERLQTRARSLSLMSHPRD